MADFATSIIGIVGAGTKVAMVLNQLAIDLGSAGKEARMIATEIRNSCTVLTTLKDSLKLVEDSPYYAHCTHLTNDMTDASVEMLSEIMDIVNSLSSFTDKMSRGKPKPIQRLQWVFQKPKIIMLRAALDSYRSNLALMLGTLDVAQKVSRRPGPASTTTAVSEDEQDCVLLENLRHSQRKSLRRLETMNPETEAAEHISEQPGSDSILSDEAENSDEEWAVIEDNPQPLSHIDVRLLRDEISSLRSSRSSFHLTDPETIRSRISQTSNRLSQLLVEDQIRISKRWSRTLPESRLSWIQDLALEQSAPASEAQHKAEQSNIGSISLNIRISDQLWFEHEAIIALFNLMTELSEVERGAIFESLPSVFDTWRSKEGEY
jgi:hypothetical protein